MAKKPKKISLIGSRATSVLSVFLVLVVVGVCATLGIGVRQATSDVADNTTILVTLLPGTGVNESAEMKQVLKSAPWSAKYDFTAANAVLSREVERMSDEEREALELLNENPFGDEFVVHIASGWRNADSLAVLSERIGAMQAVDIVNSESVVLGGANTSIDKIIIALIVVAVILLIISIVLINNTISLSIYSRRFNIHTMKLVGATNAFIRRPFVRAGMLTGLLAGALATVVVCGGQCYLMFNDSMLGPWITSTGIVLTGVGLMLLGAIIARAAAWRAATSYLNKSYDSLFRK